MLISIIGEQVFKGMKRIFNIIILAICAFSKAHATYKLDIIQDKAAPIPITIDSCEKCSIEENKLLHSISKNFSMTGQFKLDDNNSIFNLSTTTKDQDIESS